MPTLVDIGQGRHAHASGVLWLPEIRTVLAADLHLGYAWAQRRRGELGPAVEGGVSRKLDGMLDELKPEQLVIVGDLVHAPRPDDSERAAIETTLRHIQSRARVVLVPGNHDRGFLRDFPNLIETVETWTGAGVIAVHGHVHPGSTEQHVVLGHIHPALGVWDDAGAHQKIPVFIAGSRATVLPAFSPFAAGTSLRLALTQEVKSLLGGRCRIYAATGKRVVHVPAAVRGG